jgi:hypothetical protein
MGKRAKRAKKKPSSFGGENFIQKVGRPNNRAASGSAINIGENKGTPTEGKSVRNMFLEAVGVGVCGVLSNNSFSTDHKIWGVLFSFGAVASFLALFATAIARKYSKTKTWVGYGLVIVVVAIVFSVWSYNLSRADKEPSMADLGRGITNLETMVSSRDSRAEQMERYFSNQWQLAQQQLTDAQKAMQEAKSATTPRRITPEQREKFLKILLEHNNLSKTPIKIIVGKTDSETENFALQLREMLDAAGYGTDAQPVPNEAYHTDQMVMTSFEPDVAVPSFNSLGKAQEIDRIPDLFVSPTEPNQKDVDVIAVFSSTNAFSTAGLADPASVMVFYPNPKMIHDTNDMHYAYHSTRNPDKVLLGAANVLINCGISIGPMQGNAILRPGEVAFFVPQKIY